MRVSIATLAIVITAGCATGETTFGDIGLDVLADTLADVAADTPAEDTMLEDTYVEPIDDLLEVIEDVVVEDAFVEDVEPDVPDCSDLTCDEHATCTEELTGPVCTCDDGWEGTGLVCTDINECAPEPGPCDEHAICTNTDGDFECECDDGWEGTGLVCTDIDECFTGVHLCDTNATCTDIDGSYECDCNDGWMGDGFTCIEDTGGPCFGVNAGTDFNNASSMGGPWVAMKFTTTMDLKVLRAEVWTGEAGGTASLGIWSHDAGANEPDTELSSGSWTMTTTNDWQGADFTTVNVDTGQTYWVVWKPVGGEQSSLQISGTGVDVEYRGSSSSGASWNGPYFNPWKFRLFCE